jgi:hypothetical protein
LSLPGNGCALLRGGNGQGRIPADNACGFRPRRSALRRLRLSVRLCLIGTGRSVLSSERMSRRTQNWIHSSESNASSPRRRRCRIGPAMGSTKRARRPKQQERSPARSIPEVSSHSGIRVRYRSSVSFTLAPLRLTLRSPRDWTYSRATLTLLCGVPLCSASIPLRSSDTGSFWRPSPA